MFCPGQNRSIKKIYIFDLHVKVQGHNDLILKHDITTCPNKYTYQICKLY